MSSVERLGRHGFEVRPTLGTPHATIVLTEPFDHEQWARLTTAFDPPIKKS